MNATSNPEYVHVELPFIQQLQGLGWECLQGDVHVPYLTERENFQQVLLMDRLRAAVRRINLGNDGQPWLDERRVSQAVGDLQRLAGAVGSGRLMEVNQRATELLLKGTVVEGDSERHGGREQTVRFVDFERPERNDFLAINQFRVDPAWSVAGRDYIIPDIVLFVNGIPLVVVECKSPGITDPVAAGIEQLLRFSNSREWVDEPEGAERLFHYNGLMISTCFEHAVVGTIGSGHQHYVEWKDTAPVLQSEVAAWLGKESLQSQELLVAGMLRPEHLLDLLRNFTIFQQNAGRTIKIVGRYQQFRAVHGAIERLTTGKTRAQDGENDRRGGIIWHTQGSGKSLSMVFLVRKLRTLPELRRFKIVVVTDRRDLEKQLSETATLTGETVVKAGSTKKLQEILRRDRPELVFAMIQKYQPQDDASANIATFPAAQARTRRAAEDPEPYDVGTEEFPVLNESEDILVLVDEAHRTQSSDLHANLMQALPNCAKIGFTGTPIIMGDRKRTHEIFGDFIDCYTIKQSEVDGVTVPILYEGRTADAAIADGRTLDELFEDMFRDRTPEEIEAIKAKYATRGDVLEAENLIAAKARDQLRTYIDRALPDGFKAQLVATSRLAATRYQAALVEAQQEIIQALEQIHPDHANLDDVEAMETLDPESQFLLRARRHLDAIRRLEFAAIISGSHNDPPEYHEWTDKARQDSLIERFKKPLDQDGMAILCVKSMLLTGFDAPVEQVLFLDRAMQGHELLQAIARVNRTYDGKTHGLVVDYYGVARHLQEALAVYSADDIKGALTSIKDELPVLDDRHRRVMAMFQERGIASLSNDNLEPCVQILADVRLRAEFIVKLKQFLRSLDIVLPRPEALPYVRDARVLGFIRQRASVRYRDDELNIHGLGPKVQGLIDRYVESQGIDPKIAPVSITADDFDEQVDLLVSDRARASEMEHAARYHITKHINEDPVHYQKLSARLEEILETFKDNWNQLAITLQQFGAEIRQGRAVDASGLDPHSEAPFRDILADEMSVNGSATDADMLAEKTIEMVNQIRAEISNVDFWRNQHAQETLRKGIVRFLDDNDLVPFERQPLVADKIVQLARYRHVHLVHA